MTVSKGFILPSRALMVVVLLLICVTAEEERAYAHGAAVERFIETHDVRRDGSDGGDR
jgi:hypothetical protein